LLEIVYFKLLDELEEEEEEEEEEERAII